jgi:2,3-dihydroxybenzoate decarboxylase
MASGLFDECPRLNIILGHLGEGLPYSIKISRENALKLMKIVP